VIVGTRDSLQAGSELAGYRLEEEIGHGGMGLVFRAHDNVLDRSVAVKLVSPGLARDRAFRERFLVESRLAASLDHPNVLPVYDAGEIDGRLYLVMRYVEGSDLQTVLHEEGDLEPVRALEICAQIASALDAAHAKGLVHRDVKPSNVLLDEREHAYLADFGLARRLAEQAPGFDAGVSLGTPAYIAPEQIRGDPVDGRADQYALACLLHECLTGEPPFRGTKAALLFAHLEKEPPAPPGLEEVMRRALAKNPADRYSSCAELVGEVREALGVAEPSRARWPLAVAGVGAALIGAALLALFLTRGDGSQMVTTTGRLVRIDPGTNRVVDSIPVGDDPIAVAVARDKVWVAHRDEGTVWRVDPRTSEIEIRQPAHGKPIDLAVGSGRVAVANGPLEANVSLLAPATGRAENVVSIAPPGFSLGSPRIAGRQSAIWVATGDRRVGRLEPITGKLVQPVPVPREIGEALSAPSAIATDDDEVWVLGDPNERKLWVFNEETGALAESIPLPFAPTDLATGEKTVWVTSQLADTVSQIDPVSHRLTDTLTAGKGASSVAVGANAVWVANTIDKTLSRIDPETLSVESIAVEGIPIDVAVDDGGVWVVTKSPPTASPDDAAAIGVLASCDGAFGSSGDASFAAAALPLLERGARLAGTKPSDGVRGASIAGMRVELVTACTDDSAKTALAEARRLVEQVGVDVMIGPSQAEEAFVLRDYARLHPEVTFLGGVAFAQGLTLHDPAPNFFRFSPDGAQWIAALGAYAYNELGWRRVVTIGDDWHAGYLQTAGFAAGFCSLGGKIVNQLWPSLGSVDLTSVGSLPRRGIDGYVLATLPPASLALLREMPDLLEGRVVGGVFMDSLLQALGKAPPVLMGAPLPVSSPKFERSFRAAFPDLGAPADAFTYFYYTPSEAALRALEAVGGDLSGGQRRFRAALAKLELDAPNGHTRLDGRRQAIAPSYVLRAEKSASGAIVYRTVKKVEGVDQTFNGYFSPEGPPLGRNTIECKKGNPPLWARR
jgi:ABC-type branched-subunit amino acid transport system substrate-binding protein/DNA-binding beta-propeller fold protein YncE/predicted Ser/Thr protein kinase